MAINDLSEQELKRLYGHSAGLTPTEAARLFDGYPGRWWIAGGWAIEAFTGVQRPHGDLDPSVPRHELALLRRHLAGRFDVWIADRGSLLPLLPDEDPDGPPEKLLPEECENLWLRPGGDEPWAYDIILMTVDQQTWSYKRDQRIRLPLADILWRQDGVNYLRPEIQLLHKARGLRPKDQFDFEAVLPRLEPERRDWLRAALELAHPGHPWLTEL
ncbi:hypothetical protein [Microlunatus speluncae]|uniref:hypothetical protein n=1 Tax=Microlunatus speluncae TaxID=2594267 RepID=UPI001375C9EE|nr:hypothetical protein [Microlunatus speluncae]